jgi:hypothetical protein
MVKAVKDTVKYERKKAYDRKRQQDISRKGRDVGPLPIVADEARKAAACASLRVFCETYLREASGTNENVFNLEWSEDQLKVIASIEATRQEKLTASQLGLCRQVHRTGGTANVSDFRDAGHDLADVLRTIGEGVSNKTGETIKPKIDRIHQKLRNTPPPLPVVS